MEAKKIFLGAGILAFGYYVYKQYKNAKELISSLIFAPENISLDTTYLTAPKIKLTIQINNPSPNTVTLSKIFATVSLNNKQIGTVNNDNPIEIAGTATTSITLNISINSLQLIQYLLKLNFEEIKNLKINMEGFYVANNIELPLSLSYNI